MNTDHFVFFLDCSEDKIFLGGLLSFAAPGDGVTSERITEILSVELVEQRFEVELLTFSGNLVPL
jgi:hypothetical protein